MHPFTPIPATPVPLVPEAPIAEPLHPRPADPSEWRWLPHEPPPPTSTGAPGAPTPTLADAHDMGSDTPASRATSSYAVATRALVRPVTSTAAELGPTAQSTLPVNGASSRHSAGVTGRQATTDPNTTASVLPRLPRGAVPHPAQADACALTDAALPDTIGASAFNGPPGSLSHAQSDTTAFLTPAAQLKPHLSASTPAPPSAPGTDAAVAVAAAATLSPSHLFLPPCRSWGNEEDRLDLYVWDYCQRRGYLSAANALAADAGLPFSPEIPLKTTQGLLFEYALLPSAETGLSTNLYSLYFRPAVKVLGDFLGPVPGACKVEGVRGAVLRTGVGGANIHAVPGRGAKVPC